MATRKYEQRLRAEAAEETRKRILDALHELLSASPTKPPSVDEIARRARVARSTVYLVFGSRAGLFDALAVELTSGAGFVRILDAARNPDAREHMREALTGGAEMYASELDVFRVLFALSSIDPAAVGNTIERAQESRAGGIGRLARRLGDQGLLRKEVSVDDAAHLLWVLSGFEAFSALYVDRRLSVADAARVLVESAERALLR